MCPVQAEAVSTQCALPVSLPFHVDFGDRAEDGGVTGWKGPGFLSHYFLESLPAEPPGQGPCIGFCVDEKKYLVFR